MTIKKLVFAGIATMGLIASAIIAMLIFYGKYILGFIAIAILVASRGLVAIVGLLIGPFSIWNTPSHAPPPRDVAGIYTPDDASRAEWTREHVNLSALSYIRLNEDHTVEVHDMPVFDAFGQSQNCQCSATGKWTFDESSYGVKLDLNLTSTAPAPNTKPCTDYGAMIELVGRHQPYRLYQTIGDPDSGTGITYLHRSPN
jgi:hypothetical protein